MPSQDLAAAAVGAALVVDQGVAVITLSNPPVNSLVTALREGLLRALAAAAADPGVSAVVLIGAGRTFSAGADFGEFGQPPREPPLTAVVAALEAFEKPVVAALGGVTLGGGLEIALACDLRVASAGATLGLPETRLGMVPGAGGTQRLPRLLGRGHAAALIADARVLSAPAALAIGLVDAVEAGDLQAAAVAAAKGAGKRRLSALMPPSDTMAWPTTTRAATAVSEALRLVALAGQVSFAEGLREEREAFLKLRDSSEAAALRHLFLAERQARRPSLDASHPQRRIACAAVIGAGTMGAGIAAALADVGIAVAIIERDAAAALAGRRRLEEIFARRRARSQLTAVEAEERLSRVTVGCEWAPLAEVDLVIEAAIEDLAVKQALFARLGEMTRPGTLLASNTSYLDLEALATASARGPDFIGLHFFAPVSAMRLLELGLTRTTSAATLGMSLALARRLDKLPIVARAAPGLIGNRIFAAYRRHMEYLVADGAAPRQVDEALVAFGFALGPFAVADLSGLDIAWAERRRSAGELDPRQRYIAIADRLCEAGRLGRKSGAGWYLHGDRRGSPDPQLDHLLAEERQRWGRRQRHFTPEEIQRRALAILVNEAAHVLAEGVARQPSDIDLVAVNGFGFPRHRGGPLHAAERLGLGKLLTEVEAACEASGEADCVAPLLRTLVAEGRDFASLAAVGLANLADEALA